MSPSANELKVQGVEQAVPLRKRRWVWVWLMPLIWLAMVGMSHLYRGGEWMALAVAMFPAILVHKITGFPDSIGNDFVPAIVAGLPLVVLAGFLLDRARITLKMFFVSFAIGVVLAYGLTLFFFVGEV